MAGSGRAAAQHPRTLSRAQLGPLLAAHDSGRYRQIVDVGGGTGALLAGLLQQHPGVHGTLFDQPHVVADAAPVLHAADVADRVTIVAGDFFAEVPAGADAYLLRKILHDWDDADCLRILETIRAVTPRSRLLIVDALVGPPNTDPPSKFLDLMMLVSAGGRERTEPQWRALPAEGGFHLEHTTPAAPANHLIEAVPALAILGRQGGYGRTRPCTRSGAAGRSPPVRGTTVPAVTRTRSTIRPPEVRGAKDAIAQLSRPGPHRVLRGDLGMVGIPGVVFAPEEGLGLPAVAFGHDWLQPADRYADLLRHLASWGIVAAAPSSHRGVLPSHAGFAADLRTTLDVCAGVRLGDGRISVDSRRTAFAGHGIGGGAALLAAAGHPRAAAVVTIAMAQTRPSALDAARAVTVPVLHIAAGKDTVAPAAGHAEPVAAAAGGPVILRTINKASHTGFLDGSHWSDFVLSGSPDQKTRRLTRALVTAFLMHHLFDEDRVDVLVDGKVPGTTLVQRP